MKISNVLCCVLLIATSSVDARSSIARDQFKRLQPCPATNQSVGSCSGYIIDHIVPLDCGGADSPSNMQWQTVEDAKRKDRIERRGLNCKTRQVAPEDREYSLGSKGGCFYYSDRLKKVYVDRQWCK